MLQSRFHGFRTTVALGIRPYTWTPHPIARNQTLPTDTRSFPRCTLYTQEPNPTLREQDLYLGIKPRSWPTHPTPRLQPPFLEFRHFFLSFRSQWTKTRFLETRPIFWTTFTRGDKRSQFTRCAKNATVQTTILYCHARDLSRRARDQNA